MPSKGAPAPRPPTRAELDVVLSGGEGQYVEFKESVSDSLAREMVALANSGGGRIFIGIADDRSVKGVQVSNRMLSQVQDIARGCDPPVKIHLAPFAHRSHQLLMIDVPDGHRKPHGCSAGYFLRTGPNSQKMSRDELVEFVRSTVQVGFDRSECPAFRYPSDFDARAFQDYVRRAGLTSAGLKRETALVNLGIARSIDGAMHFSIAGALFFAKEPCRFLPQAEVTCVLYRDTEGVDIIDRKDFKGNLLANLEDAEAFLKKHIAVRYEIKGLYRKEIPEIPEDALRESVVNALMHRDYGFAGARVMVQMFPDRVEVSDPGGLPPGLDPRRFGTKSVHRNELIADLLHRLRLGERIGSGIRRMRASMRAAGLMPPEFDFSSFFTVTFRKAHVDAAATVTKSLTKSLTSEGLALLERARKPASLTELARVTGATHRSFFKKRHVDPLLASGLLAPTIPDKPRSRFQKYMTTEAGRERLEEARA